ncbi:MAG: hypothetical protein M1828_000616 [Chrysothrix sp. TS-e1954]|nr:MAG: hypothetical protein M1828_000616 [Chrysothrix sp. TS-e1954]
MDRRRKDPNLREEESQHEALEQVATAPLHATSSVPAVTLIQPATATPTSEAPSPRPPPTVRIRRLPSSPLLPRDGEENTSENLGSSTSSAGRRRSLSAPQGPQQNLQTTANLERQSTVAAPGLSSVAEEGSRSTHVSPQQSYLAPPQQDGRAASPTGGRQRARSLASSLRTAGSRRGSSAGAGSTASHEYDEEVVDLLDVVDPQVSTLTTLNNVQNSLFIPYLGRWANRQATYDLSRRGTNVPVEELIRKQTTLRPTQTTTTFDQRDKPQEPSATTSTQTGLTQSTTLSSTLDDTHYAVLPHGTVLAGWSEEDKEELNDHVRHLMHSKRAGFKRRMKAFGKYVQQPLGFFVTLYAFLITFWGTAWVLFLIGWISVGDRQAYFVEIADQVLTALFAVVGLGLAPFRAVDTYHMIYIAHYHYLTWRLRREKGLPPLRNPNDPPSPAASAAAAAAETSLDDLEKQQSSPNDTVLTTTQQTKLSHHERIFSQSHTFYKPHETPTHSAFSVKLLITIVVLLDCHSLFQMALGGTTWGIYYRDRPKALTAAILACSISCNITGGIVISVGDKRSRKKQVVERMFRQGLTETAMRQLRRERGIEAGKREEVAREEERLQLRRKLEREGKRRRLHRLDQHHHEVRERKLREKLAEAETREEKAQTHLEEEEEKGR